MLNTEPEARGFRACPIQKAFLAIQKCRICACYNGSKCQKYGNQAPNLCNYISFIFTKNQIQIASWGSPQERRNKISFQDLAMAKVCAWFCQDFGHQFGDTLESTKNRWWHIHLNFGPEISIGFPLRKTGFQIRSAWILCKLFKRVELGNRTCAIMYVEQTFFQITYPLHLSRYLSKIYYSIGST